MLDSETGILREMGDVHSALNVPFMAPLLNVLPQSAVSRDQ